MSTTLPREARRAHEIMTPDAQCIDAGASVTRAAERLAEAGVGALAVCDSEGRLVGVITDRDIVVRILAQGADPARTRVGDVADADPITLDESSTVAEARALMRDHGVRRLPVVRARRLVGIVGHADLLEHDAAEPVVEAERGIARKTADQRSAAWLLGRSYADARVAQRHPRHARAADPEAAASAGLERDRSDGRERRSADAAITDHVQGLLADRD